MINGAIGGVPSAVVRRCSGEVPIVLGNRARGNGGPIVSRDGAGDAWDSVLRNPGYDGASLV